MLHLPKFTKPLAFILSVITLSLSLGYFIFAWTEPDTAPPGGNVSAPINVSTDSQGKAGILEVTELKDYNDNTYFIDPSAAVSAKLSGDVQIGTNVTIKGDGNLSTGLNADKVDGLSSSDLMAMGGGSGWISTGTYFKNGGTYAFCSKQTIVSLGVAVPISINDGGACGAGSSCYNGECLSGIHNYSFNDGFESATLSESWASMVVGGDPNNAATIKTDNQHNGGQSILTNTSGGGLRSIPAVLLGSKCSLGFWMYDGGQNARSEVWGGLYNSVTKQVIFALSPRYDTTQTFWTYVSHPGNYVNTPFTRTKNAWSSVTIIYDGATGIQYTVNGQSMQSVTLASSYGVDSVVLAIGMGGNTEYIDDVSFTCTP